MVVVGGVGGGWGGGVGEIRACRLPVCLPVIITHNTNNNAPVCAGTEGGVGQAGVRQVQVRQVHPPVLHLVAVIGVSRWGGGEASKTRSGGPSPRRACMHMCVYKCIWVPAALHAPRSS